MPGAIWAKRKSNAPFSLDAMAIFHGSLTKASGGGQFGPWQGEKIVLAAETPNGRKNGGAGLEEKRALGRGISCQ